jgi:hypothetical protein
MKKVYVSLMLVFVIFATYALGAPPTFGPPGIAPDPDGDLPVIGSATPNILSTWVGKGKDMQEIFYHSGSIQKSSDSYTVILHVWAQDGPIIHAGFSESPIDPQNERIHPAHLSGFITDDGEITLFGGSHGVLENSIGSGCNVQIKAKLYKNPNKSVRGFWQSFGWNETTQSATLNSGSFNLHRPAGWED